MHHRKLHILSFLTRLIASTAIVPAILAGSLLSFPTTCTCGADRPHEHSIFEMPGHYHGDQRTTTGSPDIEFNRAGTDGVVVQSPAGASSPTLGVIFAVATDDLSVPHVSVATPALSMPDGLGSVPDVPPPRA